MFRPQVRESTKLDLRFIFSISSLYNCHLCVCTLTTSRPQAGYPLVTVRQEGSVMTLSQEPFRKVSTDVTLTEDSTPPPR